MSAPIGEEERDSCPHCGERLPTTGQTAAGWERGSCLRCGLQAVRPPGERWRAIRG